jgi:uncharacterized protein YdeI (YjbR/CyaY-like superfamily)
MGKHDPRVDAYIAKAAPFAGPILEHLRGVVHATCPDVEEAMKWSFPNFLYKGMFCSMAAFKAHCAFNFWKGDLVLGAAGRGAEQAMGQFGRITKLADLPPKKVLAGYLRKAMRLNEEGVKPRWLEQRNAKRSAKAAAPARSAAVPADLAAALRKNAKARAGFAKFPPSHRREYVEWITGAKREETRARRIATAIGWMAQGKSRNWRYEK